jgi:putative PIN family toxin of toxin-antitoxin system
MRDKFFRIPVAQRQALLDDFINLLEIVVPQIEVAICRDPDDDKFLSLAVSGNADLILTGDDDLLTLHPFRGLNILSPSTYLAQRS